MTNTTAKSRHPLLYSLPPHTMNVLNKKKAEEVKSYSVISSGTPTCAACNKQKENSTELWHHEGKVFCSIGCLLGKDIEVVTPL